MTSTRKLLALLPFTLLSLAACGAVDHMADDDPGDDGDDMAPGPDAAPPPECTLDAECPADRPVCGADQTCRGCDADAECASGACDLATGACYAAAEVVIVAPGGEAAGPCGQAGAPCGSIAAAMTQLSSTRRTVRLLPADYPPQNVNASPAPGVPFTVDGRGARIASAQPAATGIFTGNAIDMTIVGLALEITTPAGQTNPSRAIDVNAGTTVTLREVTIRGNGVTASGLGTTGIEVDGVLDADRVDISTTDGFAITSFGAAGRVAVRRSRIHGSRYGVYIGVPSYQLTNNVISHNTMQGVRIDTAPGAGAKQIEFNTFLANGSQVSSGATELEVLRSGLEGTTQLKLAPRGNLMSNGRPYTWNASTGTGVRLVGGAILPRLSLLDMPNLPPSADGNLYADAQLAADGHLTAPSPAIDALDLDGSSLPVLDDLDGDPRPTGARVDIGADEHRP
jgi:hypothetical protein